MVVALVSVRIAMLESRQTVEPKTNAHSEAAAPATSIIPGSAGGHRAVVIFHRQNVRALLILAIARGVTSGQKI
jgi:hypothetical protein